MNKIKKLIPIMLMSSIFASGSIDLLAMKLSPNQEEVYSDKLYSVDEINKLYDNSIFHPENLCKKIYNTSMKPVLHYQKVSILEEANRIINVHIKELNDPELIEQGKVQYKSPLKYSGNYPFESIMNALTVNLERTGEFNSFAKSIILYRLAEYLELMPAIKVITYDEYEKGQNVPHYEAVMLYDSGIINPYLASSCIFNPIAFDTSESYFWKKMLKSPGDFDMKEYFLAIPDPNSDERPLIFDINPNNLDPQFLGLNASRAIRQGKLKLRELKEDKNFVCNEISSDLIKKIGKSKYLDS